MNNETPKRLSPEEAAEFHRTYVPWHKRLGPMPWVNGHLSQMQPSKATRPEVLNRAVEVARERERNRFIPGSSLIAGGVKRR